VPEEEEDLHPSSGAQTTVTTTPGTCQTVAATCHYRGVVGTDDDGCKTCRAVYRYK